MKLPKNVHKILGGGLFTSLLLLGGLSAAPQPSPQVWGAAVSGLQMTISLDPAERGQSKSPKFRVELRNAGENDLILNLGIMLANGKRQYPLAVVLTLTDAQGTSRRLELREPPFVAGRVDPLVLPLPVGSAFSIPVDLDQYWPAASGEVDYKLRPGTYSLDAQLTGKGVSHHDANLDLKGIALMPYWQGTITSNTLRVAVPSH